MSSTVTNMGPLRRLLPIGSRLGTLVLHAVHRGGMGRDHLLNEARAWPYQDQRACTQHGAIHGTVCYVSGARSEEKEDPASLKDLIVLWFSSLPIYNPCFPLVYKREGRAPPLWGGINSTHHASHHT